MEIFDSVRKNTCKIRKVVSGSKLITPIILKVDNRSLTAEELCDYECSWHKADSDPKTCIVNFSNHEKDNYEGSTQLQGGLSKTMLVVQNKETNKVQLIEVNQCNLGRVFGSASLRSNYGNDAVGDTYQENRDRLLRAFGSKKGKRASQIGSGMRINSEIMSSHIKETAADVSVDVKEIVKADIIVDTCMPPINRDAVSAENVYLLEDFLTERELNSMEDEAVVMYHLEPFTEEESGYSQFLIDSMDRLQNKLCLERIKALLYIDSMLKFVNTPERKLQKQDLHKRICPFSTLVAKKITENFTVDINGSRIRNVTMEDKLVTHIVAMIIVALDSVSILELSKYIPNFSVKKMGLMMRLLCLSSRDKATWSVKLPLPQQRAAFMRRKKN